MAEFQEVAKAYVRMCESYSTCEGCPMQMVGNDFDTCRCFVLKWPSKYESKIMSWAAENPEPVYPTWIDWLRNVGIIPTQEEASRSMRDGIRAASFYVTAKAFEPIPGNIAEKLGIEPKEE